MGNLVKTLLSDFKPMGRFFVVFDGSGLAKSAYIVECHTKNNVQCKLINIVR